MAFHSWVTIYKT